MKLQVTKDGFIHDGQKYTFEEIQFIIHQPRVDRVIITLNEAACYNSITIQSTHASALLLGFARWVNNKM